jgi:hypothetical protein
MVALSYTDTGSHRPSRFGARRSTLRQPFNWRLTFALGLNLVLWAVVARMLVTLGA